MDDIKRPLAGLQQFNQGMREHETQQQLLSAEEDLLPWLPYFKDLAFWAVALYFLYATSDWVPEEWVAFFHYLLSLIPS